jgi:hypothetical protein
LTTIHRRCSQKSVTLPSCPGGIQPHTTVDTAQPAVGLAHPDESTACGPLLEALTSPDTGATSPARPPPLLSVRQHDHQWPRHSIQVRHGFCADMHSLRGSSSNLPPATGCCSACIWIRQVVQQRSRPRGARVPSVLGVQQQRQVVQEPLGRRTFGCTRCVHLLGCLQRWDSQCAIITLAL